MLKKIETYFYKEWDLDITAHKKLGIEYIAEKNGKYFLLNRIGENIHYQYDSFEDLTEKLNISKIDLREDKQQIGDYNILYRRDICDFSNVNVLSKRYTYYYLW